MKTQINKSKMEMYFLKAAKIAESSDARDVGIALAKILDENLSVKHNLSEKTGNHFAKFCLALCGHKKASNIYQRNNAHANYETGIKVVGNGYGIDVSFLTFHSVLPCDDRLNSIPRQARI